MNSRLDKVRFQGCIRRTRAALPVVASSEVRTQNPQVARVDNRLSIAGAPGEILG